RFRIALRNVTATDDVVDNACRLLQENGFINYYGLQRFGTRVDTPTYEIGRKLLQGNFREAINSLLEEREGMLQPALQRYHEAGPIAALQALPRGMSGSAHVETRLIRALAKAPNDLVGALSKLARNTRLLYLHSYQSLVWNRAVSERIQRLGLRPAEGDLVPAGSETHIVTEEMNDGEFEDEDNNENESDADTNDASEVPAENDNDSSDKRDKDKNNDEKPKVPVKVLTKEEAESGQYTIFDVIMPLPGYNIDYPPNMKDFYEEEMAKDNLKLDLRHKVKCYSMSGAYRHVAVRPFDVSWRSVRYSQPYADLLRSDRDQLTGRELTGIIEDGKYKALLLEMSLPASCYATMALRELLKVDTSCDYQAMQNNYHRRKKSKDKTGEAGDENSENNSEANDSLNMSGENSEVSRQENAEVTGDVMPEASGDESLKRKMDDYVDVALKKVKTEIE
ncbi:pseudouridylate synthase 7 homolog, partial [Ostrinia furnacalis]|uniref:pseudouridylate synthase 7 homolog n=1 Tax=Ostrinia furnacalis TaxID=93504 RepID=UPI00103D9A04